MYVLEIEFRSADLKGKYFTLWAISLAPDVTFN